MDSHLRELLGFRGEKIVELSLTNYQGLERPLFRPPAHLGEKWPAIDYYVELIDEGGMRPHLFAQVKSTAIDPGRETLAVDARKSDIDELLKIPGPTYLFGVHEPTGRVFVRSANLGNSESAASSIPLAYELTIANLQVLHKEVRQFWNSIGSKPSMSAFS